MCKEEFDGGATEAHPLEGRIDHQAPQEVEVALPRLGSEVLVVEHEKADGRFVGVDGAEPRLRVKVGLGDGLRIAGDEGALKL
jgi:hypothetical protein